MEEESKERNDCECGGGQEKIVGGGGKNHDEVEEEDVLAWLTLDEETVKELSKLLEPSQDVWLSALEDCNFKVKFIDNPYISPPVFVQSSTAYVTINGNEESCGSSFSDSESSVMASVDRCFCFRNSTGREEFGGCCGGALGTDEEAIRFGDGSGGGVIVKEIDGCDWMESGFDVDLCDDDIWEKFLGNDLSGRSF